MGRNLELALQWIATDTDKQAAWHMAVDQLAYATERERLAVASLVEVDPTAAEVADRFARELDRRHDQMRREIELAYRQTTGQRPPRREPSDVERALELMRPVLIAGPTEFLDGRGRMRGVRGLHSLMAFEVMSAVDGERTGLDIYRYVAAEAREAGAHYYGTVEPQMVREYLENAADAGLIEIR
jgi:hypothetical protein